MTSTSASAGVEGGDSASPGTAEAVPSNDAVVSALLRAAELGLSDAGIDTARIDAEVLLAEALRTNRAGVYARMQDRVSDAVRQQFWTTVERRVRREPLAYIVGHKEFYSLDFGVDRTVLIPRPETEHLVEAALAHLPGRSQPRVCDVGTGSGCVAVALAHTVPAATIVATDISPAALRVAQRNAVRHGVAGRIGFVAGNLLDPLTGSFDAIVSNPPYLCSGDPYSPELAWEPQSALAAGARGLDVIARLATTARARLRPGGLLAVEIGTGQAAAAMTLARDAGFSAVTVIPDLAGIPRVLVGRCDGPVA